MAAFALAPTLFVLGAVYTVGALMGPIFNTTSAAYRYALTLTACRAASAASAG